MKQSRPRARKRFGQNFLRDQSIIDEIIAAADPQEGDHVIEIGPGRGVLTSAILSQELALTAIEIDRDLSRDLREKHRHNPDFQLIEADVLKTDWNSLVKKDCRNKLIANLPYNISTPLFFRMVEHRAGFQSFTIMIQKEVALRISHPGRNKNLKDYGILSVIAQSVFDTKLVRDVPASCFVPEPKVNSAVIQLIPKAAELPEEQVFFEFVKRAFNQRRKLLLSFLKKNEQTLYGKLSSDTINCLKNLRAENLSAFDYHQLFYEHQIDR